MDNTYKYSSFFLYTNFFKQKQIQMQKQQQIQIPSISSLVPPAPLFSLQTAMAAPPLDCDGVDDDSQGECDQEVDQDADGFTDCNDDNINNCIAEQIVSVHNEVNSNEEAKIDQTIN